MTIDDALADEGEYIAARSRTLSAEALDGAAEVRAAGRVDLHPDKCGDFVDSSGRVIVFEIHGSPRYMVMVDGRPRRRVESLDEATLAAYDLLRRDVTPAVRRL